MGFSLAWMAMKGTDANAACAALRLERKGGNLPFPDSEFSGAALPTGWYLVVGDRSGYEFVAHNDLESLSKAQDIIVCEVEEHVMYSSAALWRGGGCLWRIFHDSDKGIYHLEAEGKPPSEFEAVRAEYVAMQDAEGGEDAGVDYIFEVPLRLAQDIAGYKHDERDVGDVTPSFEELAVAKGVKRPKAPPPKEKPPLWARPLIWLVEWYFSRDERRR